MDRYVTNSRTTQARIKTYFGRDSLRGHPPVETSALEPAEPGSHYLVLSELVSHKRIDTAVRAFTELGLPLVVAGDGPDRRRLRRLAGPNVRFAGRVSDREAARLLSTCRALVVTATEEFGIAAVEAQAAGRPVLAASAGGALETIVEGVTGCFWTGGPDELAEAVESFDPAAIDPADCVASARRFDTRGLRSALPREIDEALDGADERPDHAPAPAAVGPLLARPRFVGHRLRSRGG